MLCTMFCQTQRSCDKICPMRIGIFVIWTRTVFCCQNKSEMSLQLIEQQSADVFKISCTQWVTTEKVRSHRRLSCSSAAIAASEWAANVCLCLQNMQVGEWKNFKLHYWRSCWRTDALLLKRWCEAELWHHIPLMMSVNLSRVQTLLIRMWMRCMKHRCQGLI